MKQLSFESVDMIFVDLPYGVTAKNKWDAVIPYEPLWEQFNRIIKPHGAILLFGQDKFTAKTILSNEKMHRYNIIWEKTTPTGFLNANRMPMRTHEDIMVFYKALPTYNPQKTIGHQRKVSKAEHKQNCEVTKDYGDHNLTTYDSTERYPTSVWKFSTDKQKEAIHPTQKSVELCRYAIGIGLIATMGVCFLKDFIPMILQLPLFIKWSFGVSFIIAFIYYLYKMIKNGRC